MFMFDDDGAYVIVYAPFEKVIDVLLAHGWAGEVDKLVKVLQAMESVTTDDTALMQAIQKNAMDARQEWFSLTWDSEMGDYAGECLTPDITGPGYELRELFEDETEDSVVDRLIDCYGLPEDRERLRAQR